jgi:hypothetical protein
MFDRFQLALRQLLADAYRAGSEHDADSSPRWPAEGDGSPLSRASAAFLVALSGEDHPEYSRVLAVLADPEVRAFYRRALALIRAEIQESARAFPELGESIEELALSSSTQPGELEQDAVEKRWSVFFPEGAEIRGHEEQRIEALRERRSVAIERLNPEPIADPAREVLFTSNVLLTIPLSDGKPDTLPFSNELKERVAKAAAEPQEYWYDHPIPIGIEPSKNEILRGLRGLQQTLLFERERGTTDPGARLACLLSVSVTHSGLQAVARRYVEEELRRAGDWEGLEVFVFSEADVRRLVREVLVPAVTAAGRNESGSSLSDSTSDAVSENLLEVFGVDGAYGRHYSFLKAMPALWGVLVDPQKRGTFKIDLDQQFPNEKLVEETGASAFEHLCTPLWGAEGADAAGQKVELGMIAGALVNLGDIDRSLFTPDVPFPNRPLSPDEHIFFSALPQALSTEAEMMTRYGAGGALDGRTACLQRVHLTGGTNGILFDHLRRHRPFTPSFFGRAEDQAYILSVLNTPGPRLSYAHASGLIMRHDKHAFALEAMESAFVGKLIGDYERILYFSAYGRLLGLEEVKEAVDPFTGCFVSRIPITVTCIRFALRALGFFDAGEVERGNDFVRTGGRRLGRAIDFAFGPRGELERCYQEERSGWDLFYDILDGLQRGLVRRDARALELKARAGEIMDGCRVRL